MPMNLDLFVMAITPSIALLLVVYLTDRYDREPLQLLIKVFFYGILISIPVIIIETILSIFNVFHGLLNAFYTAFIVAGLTEELFKRLVVLKTAYHHPAFNEKLDGIVYAVFASLGFATLENIIYVVFRYAHIDTTWIMRGILAVPAHMLFAVTMGYFLSLAKYAPDERLIQSFLRKSLIYPIILHGIYNFILMSGNGILLLLLIPFMIYLWISSLKRLNHYFNESRNYYHQSSNGGDNEDFF